MGKDLAQGLLLMRMTQSSSGPCHPSAAMLALIFVFCGNRLGPLQVLAWGHLPLTHFGNKRKDQDA